ncbi:phenylalanine--tRNA ligase beta subunit [Spirochaetota bacterium]|nr:phenylalanine--tRNA ligase beta subunit [Spirochaetota bacterium]
MLLSFNWLKEYVHIELSPHVLAEKLTMLGFEVDAIKNVGEPISGLVIGEVVTKTKHPNADKLALTTIRYLNEGRVAEVPVICGAPNIASGQKIAYAQVGSQLPGGFRIKKRDIRGISSEGMVCSLAELGKEAISETIWVLPASANLDEDIQRYLGKPDVIFNIDVTSNRSDVLSVIGIAREVAALLAKPLLLPSDDKALETHIARLPPSQFSSIDASNSSDSKSDLKKGAATPTKQRNVSTSLTVTVEAAAAVPRYMAVALTGVTVAPSPRWICDRLHTHGLRPINNIVDVTNLIMLEYGQPLHAFDRKSLSGDAIIVRYARTGEKVTTLDGRLVALAETDLIIADNDRPIGLAGIMGELGSGISETTTDVIIEAACFSAAAVSKTATRTGFDTEAASRFIKQTVSADLTPHALMKAALLMLRYAGGRMSSERCDIVQKLPQSPAILFHLARVNRDLNLDLSEQEVKAILIKLGCTVTDHNGDNQAGEIIFHVTPPRFRKDLNYEWDLIEEIARFYGYDNIPIALPRALHSSSIGLTDIDTQVHAIACSLGYGEVINYPFIEEAYLEAARIGMESLLKPLNPVLQQASVLRPNILPGLLKTLKTNNDKKHLVRGKFFELGHVFSTTPPDYLTSALPSIAAFSGTRKIDFTSNERNVLGWLCSTPTTDRTWYADKRATDFYTLSGDLEVCLERLAPKLVLTKVPVTAARLENALPFLVQDESAFLKLGDHVVGYLGRVHARVIAYFDLPEYSSVYYGELDLATIEKLQRDHDKPPLYKPPSSYPYLTRDVALVVAAKLPLGEFIEDFKKMHECVTAVSLIEIYSGAKLMEVTKQAETDKETPTTKPLLKSFVFRLYLRSAKKTLLAKEADHIVEHIIRKLKRKYDFYLR